MKKIRLSTSLVGAPKRFKKIKCIGRKPGRIKLRIKETRKKYYKVTTLHEGKVYKKEWREIPYLDYDYSSVYKYFTKELKRTFEKGKQ